MGKARGGPVWKAPCLFQKGETENENRLIICATNSTCCCQTAPAETAKVHSTAQFVAPNCCLSKLAGAKTPICSQTPYQRRLGMTGYKHMARAHMQEKPAVFQTWSDILAPAAASRCK
ncbi:hypothetical protein VTK56DRAFT_5757 [Thermocarpiscus australiensis]